MEQVQRALSMFPDMVYQHVHAWETGIYWILGGSQVVRVDDAQRPQTRFSDQILLRPFRHSVTARITCE